MKISKLFHWLYAFVMFLPIVAVLSAVLINTFNMNSKQETNIVYKYETNDVNSNADLVKGNIYHFHTTDFAKYNYDNVGLFHMYFLNIENTNLSDFSNVASFEETYYVDITNNGDFIAFYDSEWASIYFYWGDDSYTCFSSIDEINNFEIEGDIVIGQDSEISFLGQSFLTEFTKCENIPIETVNSSNLNAQNVFYEAIEQVREKPLFSWAYNSFLVAPFSYIVVLFGMPTNHVVVQLLSYWLAISIIWLVFDLIMYVPLLVHRWLDKGVLE